jgi:hypothetical protein
MTQEEREKRFSHITVIYAITQSYLATEIEDLLSSKDIRTYLCAGIHSPPTQIHFIADRR